MPDNAMGTTDDRARPVRPVYGIAGVTLALLGVGVTATWAVAGPGEAVVAEAPPVEAGWAVEFVDDFEGNAGALPSDDWIYDLGHGYPGGAPNWGNGEAQYYTDDPANVSTDGEGNLLITPLEDADGGWTSARLESARADFTPPTGGVMRVEGRIAVPDVTGEAALGYWPSFWMVGSPARGNPGLWPSIGEIDIFENVNGNNVTYAALHCGVAEGGPCNEKMGLGANQPCPGSSCAGNFHTYRFEWDESIAPNEFRWYVDGVQLHEVTQDDVDPGTWSDMTDHAGYFMHLNVAIGGAFPDGVAGQPTPTDATASGVPMIVDYVGVWTLAEGGDGGAGPAVPGDDSDGEGEGADGPSTDTTVPEDTTTTVAPGDGGDGGPGGDDPGATPPTTATATPATPPGTTAAPTAAPAGAGRDPYHPMMAQTFDGQAGIALEATDAHEAAGGQHIGFIANGDWARYDDVDFGSGTPATFLARVASGVHEGASGRIEARLDSATGPVLGSFDLASTGGWQCWVTKTAPASAAGVSGRHTVYLTFTSSQPEEFVNVSWFKFHR
jgi:hypothetical protein